MQVKMLCYVIIYLLNLYIYSTVNILPTNIMHIDKKKKEYNT